MKKIIITTGDPAGIGPEITSNYLRFHDCHPDIAYIVYGSILESEAKFFHKIDSIDEVNSGGKLYNLEIKNSDIKFGEPSQKSGEIALEILEKSAIDLVANKADAVVTCPISKNEIRKTNPNFIGHTEFYADKSSTENVIMSFWHEHINVALLTTHLPLSEVSAEITFEKTITKFKLIIDEAKKHWKNPKIAVLGINPHNGENGAFGNEDSVFEEVIAALNDNFDISGPFPSDTFFSRNTKEFNLIISAYHDQGLIPFKMLSEGKGVNVTLGLPFIRTSVDHGTAFDIAGSNTASTDSLAAAIKFAENGIDHQNIQKEYQYSYFAKVYDKYMSHVSYDDWVEKIIEIYHNQHNSEPKNIYELACGTANVGCRLVGKGYKVDASDLSTEMLKVAASKVNSPNLFRKNMLEKIDKKYDLILLLFDSLNYLHSQKDVEKLFSNVSFGLEKNGLFIFDISTKQNCREYFDDYVNFEDNKNEFIIHQTMWDEIEKEQLSKLTFFKKHRNFYFREDEVHRQKIYSIKELIELIPASLELIELHTLDEKLDLSKDTYYDEIYHRIFFIIKKR